MNKAEQSIIQSQNSPGIKKLFIQFEKWIEQKFRRPFNPYNVLTADSKTYPVFPSYRVGGTANIVRVETYVRRKFYGKWYLIPIITQWENPKPLFGPEVIKEVIARNLNEAYRCFLYWKGIKEKDLHRMNGIDGKPRCQLLDINQEDESHRLGIVKYK